MERHQSLDLSHKRRVFAVGDIHGEFAALERSLQTVNYDPSQDVLISVGDLVDRGPDSEAALEWIKRPDFLRVLGNHDIALKLLFQNRVTKSDLIQWGAQWCIYRSDPELRDISEALSNAPLAMTAVTPAGHRVGFVHADCARDWNRHIDGLMRCIPLFEDLSLFSRETIHYVLECEKNNRDMDIDTVKVLHIDHVFHGHNPTEEPLWAANRSWIDTGACFGGPITVIDVDQWLFDLKV
jgi:serine/threonine protein phosphatase 1